MEIKRENFKFATSQKVIWGDIDSLQHVNNVQYIRFFETGRLELMLQSGMLDAVDYNEQFFVLAKIDCTFLKQVTFPDMLHICTRVKSIGNTSYVVEHAIFTDNQGLAAYGDGVVVLVDAKTGKKTPISDKIRAILETCQ